MSYSFSVRAADKAATEAAIVAELDKVVESQPIHATDRDLALNTAKALLALAADDPARDVVASVSGSIWKTDAGVQQVSLSVNVGFDARPAVEQPAAEQPAT